MNLPDGLMKAVNRVADEVYGDFLAQRSEDNPELSEEELLAEIVLDAKRLEMNGHAASQKELEALIAQHGWDAVVKAVADALQTR